MRKSERDKSQAVVGRLDFLNADEKDTLSFLHTGESPLPMVAVRTLLFWGLVEAKGDVWQTWRLTEVGWHVAWELNARCCIRGHYEEMADAQEKAKVTKKRQKSA